MGEQKNIDRLFREKFKELDLAPDEMVWSKIEDELDEKQDSRKRIIPIWWRLGGIAAAIAILLYLGYAIFSADIDQEQIPITNTEQNQKVKEIEEKKDITIPDAIKNNKQPVVQNDSVNKTKEHSKETNNAVVNENSEQKLKKLLSPSGEPANEVVEEQNQNKEVPTPKNLKKIPNSKPFKNINNKKEAVANVENANKSTQVPEKETNKIANEKINKEENKILKNKSENAIVANKENKNPEKDNIAITSKNNNKEKQEQAVASVENTKKEEQKTSIYDAIAQKEELEKEEEVRNNRWSINPSVAPVYYNTISEGSPIHTQFADNSKSGNINMSYGINVAYEINDRLSIRSGVNRVNVGYDTDDISIASSALQPAPIPTISYANNTASLRIMDRPTDGNLSSDQNREINAAAPGISGILTQEIGFLEVPLELKYKLIDKKIGVHLVGGFSSLFLADNSITVSSDNLITDIGEANNINNISFSTNIGFGLDYKLSKKILLNLEPIFKYQLNTFSNENGGFRPYTIGVYTGLSFKF